MDLIEIHAADYLRTRRGLDILGQRFPLVVRGGRLSLGTPGPLNGDELFHFGLVVQHARPLWVTEPAGFSRTAEVDLDFPNPVCPNEESVCLIADHARQVMENCGRPLLLENTACFFQARGPMRETELLNRICEAAGCGLLLDLAALIANSRNHRFSAISWIREIDPRRIVQVRAGGWAQPNGRFLNAPQDRIHREIWRLLEEVLSFAEPKAVTLEFGGIPTTAELESELKRVRAMAARPARRLRRIGH